MTNQDFNKDDAFKFLSTVFQGFEQGYILIWSLPDKVSRWIHEVGDVFQSLEGLEHHNVYVGAGISPKKYGRTKRCLMKDIIGIPGVWVDIDLIGDAHKKANLPATIEQAYELLKECPVQPTIIVHSGHGIQAWWLFHRIWYFGGQAGHDRATALLVRFKELFKIAAAKHKWDVDSTHDMARVMRLPGTLNNKVADDPKPVKILSLNESRRYAVEELENCVLDVAPVPVPKATAEGLPVAGAKLILDPKASPPFDKWQVFDSMEPKFRLSWERKRQDFQDKSPSTYDLSLATMMTSAGWSDQEIVNSLIASRRQNNEDLKLREDYYLRTLAKSKESIRKQKADEFIDNEILVPADAVDPSKKSTAAIVRHVSALFGIEITRIIKYTSYPAQYCIVTPTGKYIIGAVAVLISQNMLRNSIAEICGKIIPPFKADKWRGIAQALLDSAEPEDIGCENTVVGQVREWLCNYLNRNTVLFGAEDAHRTHTPFMKDGHIMIFLSDLKKWLSIDSRDQTPSKTMGAMLRSFGCRPETHAFKTETGQTTRSVWKLPTVPEIMEYAPVTTPVDSDSADPIGGGVISET